MGVAGDMLCGALIDTLSNEDKEKVSKKLNTLMDGVTVSITKKQKLDVVGTKFDVNINEKGHYHTSIKEIYDIIDSFDLNNNVKENAKAVYTVIAKAESKAHQVEVADVHLHEVGMKDAIIDVTAFCYLIDFIGIDNIFCSPIVTGFGKVNTAHGLLDVPAPATADILKNIPTIKGEIEGELTTPTGAALINHFAQIVYPLNPNGDICGFGLGTKDFAKPNCVKIIIDENDSENITELRCQIDDMTGEEMGYAINKLIFLGAKDCFVNPITMKKSRPAFELVVITTPDKKDYFIKQIFKHTITIGIREIICQRQALTRELFERNNVQIKRSTGFGVTKEKIEFDNLAKLADEKDISIFEARNLVK